MSSTVNPLEPLSSRIFLSLYPKFIEYEIFTVRVSFFYFIFQVFQFLGRFCLLVRFSIFSKFLEYVFSKIGARRFLKFNLVLVFGRLATHLLAWSRTRNDKKVSFLFQRWHGDGRMGFLGMPNPIPDWRWGSIFG